MRHHKVMVGNTRYDYKVMEPIKIIEGNGYDSLGSYKSTAIIPIEAILELGLEEAEKVLEYYVLGEYTTHCRHSFDCCGCVNWDFRIIKKKKREYTFILEGLRNV